jgi:hypothetical protein
MHIQSLLSYSTVRRPKSILESLIRENTQDSLIKIESRAASCSPIACPGSDLAMSRDALEQKSTVRKNEAEESYPTMVAKGSLGKYTVSSRHHQRSTTSSSSLSLLYEVASFNALLTRLPFIPAGKTVNPSIPGYSRRTYYLFLGRRILCRDGCKRRVELLCVASDAHDVRNGWFGWHWGHDQEVRGIQQH